MPLPGKESEDFFFQQTTEKIKPTSEYFHVVFIESSQNALGWKGP